MTDEVFDITKNNDIHIFCHSNPTMQGTYRPTNQGILDSKGLEKGNDMVERLLKSVLHAPSG
jgi:hypothetical protein